jgi:hypothetical protein
MNSLPISSRYSNDVTQEASSPGRRIGALMITDAMVFFNEQQGREVIDLF